MPLTYDQALLAAKEFLANNPFPYPEYRWVLTVGRPIAEGWYFDFRFERVDDEPPDDGFGGAPGYKVVAETGDVRVVGWAELQTLNVAMG
jgi:hypothetical protein